MVTAVLVHLAYLVSYYLRWQLYSVVPKFPVFWPSEMTSATFRESSPTVQSESSPESSPPNTDGPHKDVLTFCRSPTAHRSTLRRPSNLLPVCLAVLSGKLLGSSTNKERPPLGLGSGLACTERGPSVYLIHLLTSLKGVDKGGGAKAPPLFEISLSNNKPPVLIIFI